MLRMRMATPISISAEMRQQLVKYSRGRRVPKRLVERSKIVLMAAEGAQSQLIARALGISRPTVQLWRDRFAAQGMAGMPLPSEIRTASEGRSGLCRYDSSIDDRQRGPWAT